MLKNPKFIVQYQSSNFDISQKRSMPVSSKTKTERKVTKGLRLERELWIRISKAAAEMGQNRSALIGQWITEVLEGIRKTGRNHG
jgi:predicted DNA-binding ribbon-helix-helix protein